MDDKKILKIPQIVLDSYDELYDLCENHNKNGLLNPGDVAAWLGKDRQWLLNATYSGAVPFAFGTNKMVGRGNSCFHVLPLFSFATQGILFRPAAEQEIIEKIVR